MLSSGAKKDLLVLNLAISLIQIRNDRVVSDDRDLTKLSNKSHKQNKKIYTLMDSLRQKMLRTQDNIFKSADNPKKLGEWVRGKLSTKIMPVLNSFDERINLDILAHQLLYNNFVERDKPLCSEMQWLQDGEIYNKIQDLFEQTNAVSIEDVAYKDALRAISIIKG